MIFHEAPFWWFPKDHGSATEILFHLFQFWRWGLDKFSPASLLANFQKFQVKTHVVSRGFKFDIVGKYLDCRSGHLPQTSCWSSWGWCKGLGCGLWHWHCRQELSRHQVICRLCHRNLKSSWSLRGTVVKPVAGVGNAASDARHLHVRCC